jgi:hypothetical protein
MRKLQIIAKGLKKINQQNKTANNNYNRWKEAKA